MNTLKSNVRGVGGKGLRDQIKELVITYKPKIILRRKQSNSIRAKRIIEKFKIPNFIEIPRVNFLEVFG